MRGRGFREDQRSVSEIYGTVLIISLAFLTALLLVGAGWVIVDQITTQSEDSLAQDSMQNVDQSIGQLTGGSANDTTTFEFPEGTGSDVSANQEEGVLNVTIQTANETYWNRTVAENNSEDRVGTRELTLGTIRHQAEDNRITAYQGGALWRQPQPGGKTFILSEPNFDFTGDALDVGVVNLTNLEAITEGAEVQASQNAQAETADRLQQFMAQYWTDRYNPAVSAPVEINITIESQYADGWATYAEERMSESPKEVIYPFDGDNEKVRIVFGKIGGMDLPDNPAFGPDVLYSGASDWAYKYYNESLGEVSGNATAFNVTDLTAPPGVARSNHYQLALYNESGQWLIYNNPNKGTPGEWVDSDGNPVNPDYTEAIEKIEDRPHPEQDVYHIKAPSNDDVEAPSTPVCIVKESGLSPSASKSITDYLDKEDEGCLANMVEMNDRLVTPINTSPKWNVTIEDVTPGGSGLPNDLYVGEKMTVTVNLTNEGDGPGQVPLGLYSLNESNWQGSGNATDPEPYFNRSYLANGTQSSDNELDAGEYVVRDYEVTAQRFMTGDDWVVFTTTEADTDWVTDGGSYDTVEVKERPSEFAIEGSGEISLNNSTPKEGEYVEVTVTVNETEGALSDPETQAVRLETDNRIINQTDVTLDAGEEKSVTMGWTVRDGTAPEVNLTASTYDDDQNKTVTVTEATVPEPEFEVTITDVEEDVVAGEELDVEADVENVGNASGDAYVELSNFDGELVGVIEVSGLDDGDTTTETLTWQTQAGDDGTGDLTVEVEDDSDTAEATVKPPGATASDFEVTITGTNSPVTAGQELTVDATVTNTGNESGTQFVYLTNFDGDRTDFAEVSLDSGDSTDLTMTWETSVTDNGTDAVTVASDDDDADESVTVESPSPSDSNFEVAIQGNNFGVTAGDSLSVDVDVTNSGNETDTQIVYLEEFDGTIVDTVEVGPLDPGDSTSITLSWDTSVNDADRDGDLTVASNDDTDTASAEVFSPSTDESNFQVTINSTNSPVTESEPLTVTATIENTGNSSDTQFVVLENFDGGPVAVKEISLSSASGSNASVTTTFTWDTIVGDADTGQVSVVSADDAASANAEIKPKEQEERAPLDVVFVMDRSGSMGQCASDDCDRSKAEAAIEASQNAVGSLNESKDRAGVGFFWHDSDIKTSLTSNMNKVNQSIDKLNKGYRPSGGTRSDYGMDESETILEDSTDPDREKVVVLLSDGANNGCKGDEDKLTNDDVTDCGGPNKNSLDTTRDLADDNTTVYSVGYGNTDPDDGDIEIDVPFLKAVAENGSGEYYNASNDEQLANAFDEIFAEITEPDTPTFDVDIVGTNEPVESGKMLEVDVNVTNTGAADGEKIISLQDFDGTNVNSTSLSLSQGESETVTLGWDTTGTQGSGDVTVKTVDDSDSETVDIMEPSTPGSDFRVTINSTDSPVTEGETLTVEATVLNLGAQDTQEVVLWDIGNNSVVDTTELTLGDDQQDTVTLSWDTEIGDAGSGDVTVVTADDEATEAVEVLPNDGGTIPFTVDIDEGASTLDVVEGETVFFNVTVTNEGNETADQQVYLEDYNSNGLLDATQTGDLGPGESTDITLTWDTSVGDGGLTENFTVSTASDSDNAPVNVTKLEGTDSNFEVEIEEATSDNETIAGNTLTVNATITNTGPDADDQNVVLWDFGNSTVADIESVSLDSNESQTVTLTWNTEEADVGTGDITVESDDDADTMDAEVLAPNDTQTDLEIVNVDPESSPTAGDTLDAEVTIENNGSADAVDEWISMELNDPDSGTTVDGDYRQVSIPAGENETFDMDVETTESTVGDYDLTVETNADEQTEVVTINKPTTAFEISIENTNDPVDAGEKLDVVAEVTNTNSGSGTDEATVVLNNTRTGTTVDMMFDVEVERGESRLVTLTWDTAFGDGDDDNPVEIWAEIANTDRYDDEDVQINEARNDLDEPTMSEPKDPLNIDLEEIEIGT